MAENSLDAVSDRDFAIEFCAAAALVMTHISRLAEEFVIWLSPRFAFISTAGSLHDRLIDHAAERKIPDVPELARGKVGRVTGHLVALTDADEGRSHWLITRTTRKIRNRCSTRSIPSSIRFVPFPRCCPVSKSMPMRCAARPRKATRPQPTWPIIWCEKVLHFATRTKQWHAQMEIRRGTQCTAVGAYVGGASEVRTRHY